MMPENFTKPIQEFTATTLNGIADILRPRIKLVSEHNHQDVVLPDSFFARPDAQTEWWYYTGHCTTESGRSFGFELVFFKRRTDHDRLGIVPVSLIANPIYAAHFAITDEDSRKFHYDHIRSFGGLLDPRVVMKEDSFDVSIGDWSVRDVGGKHVLRANLDGIVFDAILEPSKPLVLNGDDGNGVSRKMKGTSRHFSFTRMSVEGTIVENNKSENFTGNAWMDREYGFWEQTNWDWFSIQFNDNTELMIYQFRTESGDANGDSTGTFVDRDGVPLYLKREDFAIEPLDSWISERTGVEYPSGWLVKVASLDIEIEVKPVLQDQELDTRGTTMVIYWEGACMVTGKRGSIEVDGRAYVELVGYMHHDGTINPVEFLVFNPLKRLSRLWSEK